MTHPSVDGDKSNSKQQKKALAPKGPAQLTRNIPQEKHTLSDRGACKVQDMPLEAHKLKKSRAGQLSQILCLS